MVHCLLVFLSVLIKVVLTHVDSKTSPITPHPRGSKLIQCSTHTMTSRSIHRSEPVSYNGKSNKYIDLRLDIFYQSISQFLSGFWEIYARPRAGYCSTSKWISNQHYTDPGARYLDTI
ncbi:hypothetical protein BDD12DRAFT_817567 [Trichophaea hybrida]|nr:hypothetical protein BDD12DRAFT_817567 [Trichophaea hybrida]